MIKNILFTNVNKFNESTKITSVNSIYTSKHANYLIEVGIVN